MVNRTLFSCAAIACLMTAANSAAAADKRDLTGIWTNASETTLERPNGITALEVSAAEAKRIAGGRMSVGRTQAEKAITKTDNNTPPTPGDKDFGVVAYDAAWTAPGEGLNRVNGKYRSSHIIDPVDGKLPYIDSAAAKARVAARADAYATGKGPYDGPENATLGERCILNGSSGPGMLHASYNNNFKFVLTKDYLGIATEYGHDVRPIPIFSSAQKAKAGHGNIPRWQGDSVAWWQGDTLVIESININKLQLDASASGQFAMSPKAKVREYLTRTGPNEINYKFTVDDPVYYTKPWTAELSFQPVNAIYEYACSEGNYGLEGMLSGARAKDAERQATTAK